MRKKTDFQKREEHQKPKIEWGFGKYKPQDFWGDKCACPYHNMREGKCRDCGGKA